MSHVTTKKVSIVMSVYKESVEQIMVAMKGILAQDYSVLEYVVVLDDPTNKKAQEYIEGVAATDDRVVVLINKENMRLGASLNRGIQVATGEYIARMDADDRCVFPERISKQVAYMQAHPETDLLFTWWEETKEGIVVRTRKPNKVLVQNMRRNFFTRSFLLHPTLLAKRSVFLEHTYPEVARPEDFILFLQLIRKGYQFGILEEVLYTYTIDSLDSDVRYRKIHTYSKTLLPHLLREAIYFWLNPFFWWYVLRISVEYLISRQKTIFYICHGGITRLVRLARS